MKKRNNSEIILIEKSWIIRSGLSGALLEDFGKVEVYENIADFDSFLSIIEAAGNCCVIIDYEKISEYKRYFHRIPDYAIVIPLFIGNPPKDAISQYKFSINIIEDKEVILETVNRSIDSLNIKEKNEKPLTNLTKREQLILQLIAKGFSSKKIAEYLNISLHTVLTHRKNISAKLEIKTVSGLTVYAMLNNLIKIEEAKLS